MNDTPHARLPLYGCIVLVPPGTPWSESLSLALLMQGVLLWDDGEARTHAGFEVHSCQLGILEGGTN